MLVGAVFLIVGIALVPWGAKRFTDGAIRTAARFSLSAFYVGIVVSGFEPENLVTGVAAAVAGLDQIALGTVIGSAVFMLTAGLGMALLIVPMEVRVPHGGAIAVILSVAAFAGAIWDGTISRLEGALLVLICRGPHDLALSAVAAVPAGGARGREARGGRARAAWKGDGALGRWCGRHAARGRAAGSPG